MCSSVAQALGISEARFDEALQRSQGWLSLAQALHTDIDDLEAALWVILSEALEQAAEDGRITHEQARQTLACRDTMGLVGPEDDERAPAPA